MDLRQELLGKDDDLETTMRRRRSPSSIVEVPTLSGSNSSTFLAKFGGRVLDDDLEPHVAIR